MKIKVNAIDLATNKPVMKEFETTPLIDRAPDVCGLLHVARIERRWNSNFDIVEGERAFFFSPCDGYSYVMTKEEFRYYVEHETMRGSEWGRAYGEKVLRVLDGTYEDWYKDKDVFAFGHPGYIHMEERRDGRRFIVYGDWSNSASGARA